MLSIAKHIVTFRNLRIHVTKYGNEPDFPDLLLLHGFMGSGDQFNHLLPELSKFANPITVDFIPFFENKPVSGSVAENSTVPELIPHPDNLASDVVVPVPFSLSHSHSKEDDWSDPVAIPTLDASLLADGLQKAVSSCIQRRPYVLGYSMGARLSLCWAAEYTEYAEGLILESGTAGIPDPQARKERREADAILAEKIQSDFSTFLKEWEQRPLFIGNNHGQSNSSPSEPLLNLKTIQQDQNPDHIAHWLTDFGTGSMPPLQDELYKINCPVLLISGALDRKFCEIATNLRPLFPDACHQIIPEASHRVHIDAPDAYITLIRDFLPELEATVNNEFRQSDI